METATPLDEHPTTCKILKEGYLTTEKKQSNWLHKRTSQRAWCVLERDQVTAFSTYKDETKSKLKETFQFFEVNKLEVDKHKDDTYLCIRYGKQILHLRAETKQDRDEWYQAIMRSLSLLGATAGDSAAANGCDDDDSRRRSTSVSTANRPPVTTRARRPSPGVIQSSPGLYDAFQKELKEVVSSSTLTAVEEHRNDGGAEADDDDEDLCKIRQSGCRSRFHEFVPDNKATNDYMNVHFVRSKEEMKDRTNCRSEKLRKTAEIYTKFHELRNMQHDDDPVYEECITAVPRNTPQNDLSSHPPKNEQPPLNFSPNIFNEGDTSSSCSSIEDNSEELRASRLPPPPVPPCTGERLMQKTRQLKEEQRQLTITKTFEKSCLVGDKDKITLMEENDGLWVIGLDQQETRLRGALKVGDQLIKINSQTLPSAAFAMDIVRTTDDHQVQFGLKRIPYGFVCAIRRRSPRDDLGIQLNRNEIINVDPYGLASKRGDLRPQTTGVTAGRMCNWAITEINAQAVDLFASSDDVMKMLRQAKEYVVLIVQPVDFIQSMREALNGAN